MVTVVNSTFARPLLALSLSAILLIGCSSDSPTALEGGLSPSQVAVDGLSAPPAATAPEPTVAESSPSDSVEAPTCGAAAREGAVVGAGTPVLAAVVAGDLARLQALIDSGAEVDEVAVDLATTPLVAAITDRCSPARDALLAAGADVNLQADGGYTPLIAAARTGDAVATQQLLDGGALIDAVGVEFYDALAEAIMANAYDVVLTLLAAGAAPEAPRGPYTPIELAVTSGLPDMVKALAGEGVEVAPALLYWAIAEDDAKMLHVLLELGVDPSPPIRPPAAMGIAPEDPAEFAESLGLDHLALMLTETQ